MIGTFELSFYSGILTERCDAWNELKEKIFVTINSVWILKFLNHNFRWLILFIRRNIVMEKNLHENETTPVTLSESESVEEALEHIKCKALELIESDEVRKFFRTWLTYTEDYAEIVFNAPIPLEKKLSILQFMAEHHDIDPEECRWNFNPSERAKAVSRALKARYDYPEDTIFKVTFGSQFDPRVMWFSTFDEAIDFIKRRKSNPTEKGIEASHRDNFDDHGDVYCVDKLFPREYRAIAYLRWFIDINGDILYYDYLQFEDNLPSEACRLYFGLPFKVGDIVMTDCQPFAKPKKILILTSAPHDVATDAKCMFINYDGKLDVGSVTGKEFLPNPLKVYVPVDFRAKTYNGELNEEEAPLGILSKILKESTNPKLAEMIYYYVERANDIATYSYVGNMKTNSRTRGKSLEDIVKKFNL